jgi:single-strand DNA-binding protein
MMFDTPVTIIGNVLTAPEWRRTTNTGTMLVTFKVASTSRRYDRERGQWVDGDSLRVRVACWRRLGENVSLSVQLGDPVVVFGRIYSRDWTDDQGARRTSYELDAVAVGHDLSRGVGKFARRKAAGATDMVNDGLSAATIGGELTERVEDPERPEDLPPDHELFENFEPEFVEVASGRAAASSRAATGAGAGEDLRRNGPGPDQLRSDQPSSDELRSDELRSDELRSDELRSGEPRSGEPGSGGPGSGGPGSGELRSGELRSGEPRSGDSMPGEPGSGELGRDEPEPVDEDSALVGAAAAGTGLPAGASVGVAEGMGTGVGRGAGGRSRGTSRSRAGSGAQPGA